MRNEHDQYKDNQGGSNNDYHRCAPLPLHNNDNDDDKDRTLATDVHDLFPVTNAGPRWSASTTGAHSNLRGYAKGVGAS